MLDNLLPNDLLPQILSGVISAMMVALLALVLKIGLHKPLLRKVKARNICNRKRSSVGVLVCEFEGDASGRLAKMVKRNIQLNYVGPTPGKSPIKVISFPLCLPAIHDEVEANKFNERTARKWLLSAKCDIIIWGERVDDSNISVIKVLGKNHEAPPRKVDLKLDSSDLNNHVADAITIEVINEQTKILENPESVNLVLLKSVAEKSSQLVRFDLPGFTVETSIRIRRSLIPLLEELCRRSPGTSEWDDALTNSLKLIELSGNHIDKFEFLEIAVNFASCLRRRAWAGVDSDLLRKGIEICEDAYGKLRKEYSNSDLFMQLDIEILFLRATFQRDFSERKSPLDTTRALNYIKTCSTGQVRQLCISYLLSVNPLDYLKIKNVTAIKPGWLTATWNRFSCAELPDDLRATVLESLVEEQFSAATVKDDEKIYEDLVTWYFLHEQTSNDLTHLFWAATFAQSTAAILRRCSLAFFRNRFQKNDILTTLSALGDKLSSDAVHFQDCHYLEIYALRGVAASRACIAAINGELTYFSMADSAYSRLQNIIETKFPHQRRDLLIERSASLNNWAARQSDMTKVDAAIKLLNSVEADADAFGCYVLAFSHNVKARLLLSTVSSQKPNEFENFARKEANLALSLCKKAKTFSSSHNANTTKNITEMKDLALETLRML